MTDREIVRIGRTEGLSYQGVGRLVALTAGRGVSERLVVEAARGINQAEARAVEEWASEDVVSDPLGALRLRFVSGGVGVEEFERGLDELLRDDPGALDG